MNPTPRPGWYLDPSDRAWLRWWTGSDWTEFRQPNLRQDTAVLGPQSHDEALHNAFVAVPGWWRSRTDWQRFALAVGATALVAGAALLPMGLVEAASPGATDSSCETVTMTGRGC